MVDQLAKLVNKILNKLGFKLARVKSIQSLELEIEHYKSRLLSGDLIDRHELERILAQQKLANLEVAFQELLDDFNTYKPVPGSPLVQAKEKYAWMLLQALTILSDDLYSAASLTRQVDIAKSLFFTLINLQHREMAIIADALASHYVRMLQDPEMTISLALQMYECLYGLYWCCAPSIRDMRSFDRAGVQPLVQYLQHQQTVTNWMPDVKERNLAEGSLLKIAYLCHYAHFQKGNAIAPHIFSLTRSHARLPDRQIFIYCVQWVQPDFIAAFEGTPITVRTLPQEASFQSLPAIIQQLQDDGIDVVLTDVSSGIATYLFSQRAAPIQLWLDMGYPFWNIPELDWVFIPARKHQPEYLIPVDRSSSLALGQEEITLHQPVDPSAVEEARALLPSDCIIFAVFTRLIKITVPYLDLVRRLLLRNPHTHFLVIGTGDPRLVYSFMDEIELQGRVTFFHRNVDLNIFGRVIDVFLDTFPFVGGNACREVAIHGKPIMSFYVDEWEPMLKNDRDLELLATTIEDYEAIAHRLVNNPEFYQAKSRKAAEITQATFDITATVQEIDTVIQKILDQQLSIAQ